MKCSLSKEFYGNCPGEILNTFRTVRFLVVAGSKESGLTSRDGQVYSRVATDITLYSRAWCSWCIDAKEYLTERGYQFTEIDVGKDREAYNDMLDLSDQTYVPTLVAGDEVLANFDTDQLEAFLNKHGIEP